MLSACTVLVMIAGPVGFATANATSASAGVSAGSGVSASTSTSTSDPAGRAVTGKAASGKAVAKAAGKPVGKAAVPKDAVGKGGAQKAGAAAPKAAVAVAAAKTAAPAAPPDPYAVATLGQLEPSGLYGGQEHFAPSSEQWQNARTIVQVTKGRHMSPYAAVIAVSVAMQESSLHNLTAAIDADSLGLFQQRPSMGWGSARELTDPAYATTAFLSALTQYAPGYGSLPLWQAAQQTQRSGYPTAYARWEDQAAHMVQQIAAG